MSGFLLDTNVLSEVAKPVPDERVIAFLSKLEDGHLSVLTIHELSYGLERLEKGSKRRVSLERTVEGLLSTFGDRIYSIGAAEARTAAVLRAQAQAAGKILHLADALIAATAQVHGLTLATRNTSDFAATGVALYDPWAEPES